MTPPTGQLVVVEPKNLQLRESSKLLRDSSFTSSTAERRSFDSRKEFDHSPYIVSRPTRG